MYDLNLRLHDSDLIIESAREIIPMQVSIFCPRKLLLSCHYESTISWNFGKDAKTAISRSKVHQSAAGNSGFQVQEMSGLMLCHLLVECVTTTV